MENIQFNFNADHFENRIPYLPKYDMTPRVNNLNPLVKELDISAHVAQFIPTKFHFRSKFLFSSPSFHIYPTFHSCLDLTILILIGEL
jgi:hypothetical protein